MMLTNLIDPIEEARLIINGEQDVCVPGGHHIELQMQ